MPRRQSSVRRFGVLGASLALALGCHADPDVVATKKADSGASSGLVSTKKAQACEAGRYEGHMNTVADGGVAVPFSADINFSLVQDRAGEFQVLADSSPLSGGNNETGPRFTAEITGGNGCSEGKFSTELVDGKYWTTADTNTAFVPFEGTIAGTYTAEFHGFNGTWSTTLHITPTFDVPVSGTWSANYAGPVMTTPN